VLIVMHTNFRKGSHFALLLCLQKKVAMVMKKTSTKGQIMMICGLLALFIFLFILVFFT